jgi:integral membrane protein
MYWQSPLGRLRLLAHLEGISYLLFAITMPLKYLMAIPEPNYVVGVSHGLLFILYIASSLQNIIIYKLNIKKAILVLVASVIPFGTFILDAKLLRPMFGQHTKEL